MIAHIDLIAILGTFGLLFLGGMFGIIRFFVIRYIKRVDGDISKLNDKIDTVRASQESLLRDLPVNYLRRDDWIRFETTVNHKLDALYTKITELFGRTK